MNASKQKMSDEKGRNKLVLDLAGELLEDIELSRLSAEPLLLKVARLARLIGNEELRQWLNYELTGYNATEPLSLEYVGRTGRWVDVGAKTAYWGPLGQQEAAINALNLRLQGLRIPDINTSASSANPHEIVSLASNHAKAAVQAVITESRGLGM